MTYASLRCGHPDGEPRRIRRALPRQFDTDRLPVGVVVLQKAHEGRKGSRIGLHRLLSQIGQRGIGDVVELFDTDEVLSLLHLGTAESLKVSLDPFRHVGGLGIFPGAKPEKGKFHVPMACLLNEPLNQCEVIVPFLWFDQFPGYRQKQAVHSQCLCLLPDPLHIRQ